MAKNSYLLFNFNGTKYGIKVDIVQENFYLPEVTTLAETPKDILGIINLRGVIVPIMHLGLRLNYPLEKLTLDDSVIVINWQNISLGILVNTIETIVDIDYSAIETNIDYGRVGEIKPSYIAGLVEINNQTVILLNHDNLVRESEQVKDLANIEELIGETNNFSDFCQLNLTQKDKEVFQERAKALKLAHQIIKQDNLQSLAIFKLNEEYYGVNLNLVKEFIEIKHFTPVPRSPNYIIGNCNWRGEIVTIVDLRYSLELPIKGTKNNLSAAIIADDNQTLAVAVDEIFDVINISLDSLNQEQTENQNQYSLGILPYQTSLLTLIDIKAMLEDGIFQVKKDLTLV